ncbi:MAG: HTTM domain-containing protein [Armatimonadaceae bacterium]
MDETATKPTETSSRKSNLKSVLDRLFGIDLRALACFRILLALYILLDLGWRAVDLEAFYTDFGAFPVEAALTFQYVSGPWVYLAPHMYVSSVAGAAILFALHAAFAVMLLIGWKTRLATFLVWVMVLALQARNPLVLHSGDVYLRMMLFWSLFLPLGARYSVDGIAAHQVARQLPLPVRAVSMGTTAILLQVVVMYWFTMLLKNSPEWRSQFSAVYYALSIEQYAQPLGQVLREVRWLMPLLTIFTGLLEIVGPLMAFSPVATARIRIFVVASFFFFHLVALNAMMNIGLFVYIAAIPWVLFLPAEFWDAVTVGWGRLPENPIKGAIMRGRDAAIAWRSRKIAHHIHAGVPAPRLYLHPAIQGVVAYFILHSLLINVRSLGPMGMPWAFKVPEPPTALTLLTRTDQNWAMFAPRPTVEDGWYVIPARTVRGHWVDLFRNGAPLSWEKPSAVAISYSYPNDRWCKFLMNLWGRVYSNYRVYYARYLDRQWHQNHSGPEALEQFQVYFMLKETQPNYQPYKIVPKLLWAQQCTPVTAPGTSEQQRVQAMASNPSPQEERSTHGAD